MDRSCLACGKSLAGRHPTARTCDDRCKKRAQRGARVTVLPTQAGRDTAGTASVVEATRAELEAAGRLDSALGQMALAQAERLESSRDTGSAYAALSKEWRATLAEATKGAESSESALDRLRRLRAERLGRGA